MVDLHSHLLPGIDDGSRSVGQSVDVLTAMAGVGVLDVCLTPHLNVSELMPKRLREWIGVRDAAYEKLIAAAPSNPRLHRGAELMLDQSIPPDAELGSSVSIAASRYVLVEFPTGFTAQTIRALVAGIIARGFVPLLAHIERYPASTPDAVRSFREAGAAIQVDAFTLAAGKGPRADRAKAVIESGLADILAADNHGDHRTLGPVNTFLRARHGEGQAELLLEINPSLVLSDGAIEAVPPLKLDKHGSRMWARLFRRN